MSGDDEDGDGGDGDPSFSLMDTPFSIADELKCLVLISMLLILAYLSFFPWHFPWTPSLLIVFKQWIYPQL
jgi:hypothetical protein